MVHVRLLRVLLAGLLVLLGGLVLRSINPRREVHSQAGANSDQPRVDDATITTWRQGQQTSTGSFEHVEGDEKGPLLIEGITGLEIQSQDRRPLIIDADRGDRDGSGADQLSHFEAVTLRDPEKGLSLSMPILYVDEAAEEARSSGDIRFEAPGLKGRASELVYSLSGKPSRLVSPELEQAPDGRLTAERAVLLDGVDDVELSGQVHVVQPEGKLQAGRARLQRDERGRLRHVAAVEGVSAAWHVGSSTSPSVLEGAQLELDWDRQGQLERLHLEGNAQIRRGTESLAAPTIEAVRQETGQWGITAGDGVHLQGQSPRMAGSLRAEKLRAVVDEALALQAGEVTGSVSFEGNQMRAEADRATFEATTEGGHVQLFSGTRRKARLAEGRIRVAADHIQTSPGARWLTAEQGVEATLLADAAATGASANGLFAMGEAVHFVSARLESQESGNYLLFTGTVRGWQDQRNLSAQRVLIDERRRRLEARESVCTRLPRISPAPAVGDSDYVQICADELDYDESTGRVDYRGSVHMSLAEGWLESRQLQVTLAQPTRSIGEVQAFGAVQLEWQGTDGKKGPGAISGKADRVVYQPAERMLRLIGEDSPASVRRIGQGGGTTTGRLLRYSLDRGTLEVDSGGGGPAQIRTADG